MIDTTPPPAEKAFIIGATLPYTQEYTQQEYLDELQFLVQTAGGNVVKRISQRLDAPNPRTYIGPGKVLEIAQLVQEDDISLIVFDDELSPTQFRNLEQDLNCRVIDRTNLILDIFAQRARTAYAKKQVELAQYQYLLPRLTGMWQHLERQRGGIGLRGPGEREIETDRRIVRQQIAKLKNELLKIDRQMATQRKGRHQLVRTTLVGYTNVGKSTLMNLLARTDLYTENKLFATLDTTVRRVPIGNGAFLLSDTVGFIRKLPTMLVESFKSTLDEVREADLLLHVVDISHPNFESQIATVNDTLREIGAGDKPQMLLFNKIDAYTPEQRDEYDLSPRPTSAYDLEELERMWMNRDGANTVFLSAATGQNVPQLKAKLLQTIAQIQSNRYPYLNPLTP